MSGIWPRGGAGPYVSIRMSNCQPYARFHFVLAPIGEYILEDLSPMTTYDLRFGCKNRVGFSPWSSGQQVMIGIIGGTIGFRICVQVTMPKRGKPEPPLLNYGGLGGLLGESGILEWDTSEQYHLSWQLPEDNGLPIDMFLLRYFPVSWSHNLTTLTLTTQFSSWGNVCHGLHFCLIFSFSHEALMSGETRGVRGESQQLEEDW